MRKQDTAWIIPMMALRASGVSMLLLSDTFHKDRKTIKFHLRRYNIVPIAEMEPRRKYGTRRELGLVPAKPKLPEAIHIPLPPGKYDYLFEDLWENRTLGE